MAIEAIGKGLPDVTGKAAMSRPSQPETSAPAQPSFASAPSGPSAFGFGFANE